MQNSFLIVANWKSNIFSFEQIEKWFEEFSLFDREKVKNVEISIAPPYPFLEFVNKLIAINGLSNFSLASQDVSQYPVGAYTGEVSAKLLAEIGAKYCLIGHSERRKYLKEDTDTVLKKFDMLDQNNIIPIVCAQNEEEIPREIVENKERVEIAGHKYMVMYEPFEAISKEGQYNAVSTDKVSGVIQEWQGKLQRGTRLLYGGSVNKENAKDYLGIVSGFVVGHASINPEEFFKIIEQCNLQANP